MRERLTERDIEEKRQRLKEGGKEKGLRLRGMEKGGKETETEKGREAGKGTQTEEIEMDQLMKERDRERG